MSGTGGDRKSLDPMRTPPRLLGRVHISEIFRKRIPVPGTRCRTHFGPKWAVQTYISRSQKNRSPNRRFPSRVEQNLRLGSPTPDVLQAPLNLGCSRGQFFVLKLQVQRARPVM